MKPKFGDHVNETELSGMKLTEEEINSIECFSKLPSLQKEDLKDLIFNLSMVLYKSFKNESA